MIVDSIGIYELKGSYYTLTMIDWFLQALSVIPMVQIKRLGPGKFYISNQCVGGNPSSHKGWMSRMSKAEMLKALKARKTEPEGASRSLDKGKRKAEAEGGQRREKRHHENTPEPARETIPKIPISEPIGAKGKAPEQQSTEEPYVLLDACAISFVAKPSGSVSLDFTRRLIPDQDYDVVKSIPDLAALEASSLHFMQALVGSGEVANRLTQAREEITKTKHSMDEQLVEIRANNDKEKEVMALELEASRSEAQLSKARALRVEEENKVLQAEVGKWRGEAANSWELGKEKFLQSKEFRVLCSGKALAFFEKGFDGCLAQFRESGYTEEEHPAPFLDVERALAALSDDEDAEESNLSQDEAPPA
ncbi:hypothetical protein F511_07297 [Dorcoceras hygrometricum]|uniref:Uncharacterized protein n=1 Tax=Dorcoceras hygrometricum TaxID=472368 RepID=A0A2Z7AVA5_9LAMI|nr:hypothetical protein F511_07297 [Dorcoceras hygrometricum]